MNKNPNRSTNKKVLLRERKRHTARRAASARYAGGGGGYHPDLARGVPPPSRPGWGVPRYPLTIQTGPGGYPDLGWGTPHHPNLGSGTPLLHHPDLGWITPPPRPGTVNPPINGEQTDIPQYKYYLPSYYVRGRLILYLRYI